MQVVFVFYELLWERHGLPPRSLEVSSPAYVEWKDEVVLIERTILKELGFSLYASIEHPQPYVFYILNEIEQGSNDKLAESAWHYLNESKKLDTELRFDAMAIAAAAILLAANVHDFILPQAWWVRVKVDYDAMKAICNEILDMYDMPEVSQNNSLQQHLFLIVISLNRKGGWSHLCKFLTCNRCSG